MKKSAKQAVALLIGAVMLLTMAPAAFAEVSTSRLPAGNSSGRLIEASMSVRVGNDVTMDADDPDTYQDGAVLADGFHFAAAEILNYTTAADISVASDSVTLTAPDGNSATTGTRTLDSTNNTVEFEWTSAKSVKRLEMWVWPVGAIKGYEIKYWSGTDWVRCSVGTLDQTQPVPDVNAANYGGKRAVSYIMTFDEVNTTKLRFIAKTFKDGYTSAKIGEAVPRSDNNVNLLALDSLTKGDNTNGWLSGKQNTTNAAYNTFASPYALNFACSAKDGDTYSTYAYNDGRYPFAFPAAGNNRYWTRYVVPNSTAGFWYAVRLTDSPQKVNKVRFSVTGGAVRSFEVWCNTGTTATLQTLKAAPSGGSWTLMTTVTGTFQSGTAAEAYIPDTVAAEYWMIKITDYDSTAKLNYPGLYVLHQGTSLFGNGAAFGDGKDAGILTDNFYYVKHDCEKMSDPDVKQNLAEVAKFTSTDSGIQYSNEVPTTETVRRLDLWILNDGGIKDYHVAASDDGSGWTTVKSGTFARGHASYTNDTTYNGDGSVNKKADTFASYYPVIFDNPVNAAYVRFVIDSFYDDTKGAYISQAILSDTNEINLAAYGKLPNNYSETNSWAYSPYIVGFSGTCAPVSYDTARIWCHYSNGYQGYGMVKESGNLYYATTFGDARVKVNRVGINLSAGSITQFEVWRGLDDTGRVMHYTNNAAPFDTNNMTKNQYERVAVVDCNITTANSSSLLFDIPRAVEADAYMIKVTACSDNANISSFKFYSLADSELSPAYETPTFTGTVAPNEELTFNILSCNETNADAAVFFGLYDGSLLLNATINPLPISGGIGEHIAHYTVPADAAGENLTACAYFWNQTTLTPILGLPRLELNAE